MFFRSKPKIFCIGFNKTGTTSLAQTLHELGYRLGDQPTAEFMLHDWSQRRLQKLIKYCRTADAFQDVPFSLPYTYQALDQAYPDAKYILTHRDTPDQWFDSMARFHAKIVKKSSPPTAQELQAFDYRALGWLWDFHRLIFQIDEQSLFDREIYTRAYLQHIEDAKRYFYYRPNTLLLLNLSDPQAPENLARFLNIPSNKIAIHHLNRSA